MNTLIEHPKTIPARDSLTGIGWLWQCAFQKPGAASTASVPDAFCPASQRQSGAEALTASSVFGIWSFLAVGCLLLERFTTLALPLLLWLPAWLFFIHAVILLPPLIFLTLGRMEHQPAVVEKARNLMALAMLIGAAWLLLTSAGSFARALGWFWIVLILLETGLRLLRSGLRLACGAN